MASILDTSNTERVPTSPDANTYTYAASELTELDSVATIDDANTSNYDILQQIVASFRKVSHHPTRTHVVLNYHQPIPTTASSRDLRLAGYLAPVHRPQPLPPITPRLSPRGLDDEVESPGPQTPQDIPEELKNTSYLLASVLQKQDEAPDYDHYFPFRIDGPNALGLDIGHELSNESDPEPKSSVFWVLNERYRPRWEEQQAQRAGKSTHL
ncbi:predicted protein [Postia placenta Mad-698-R]|uniref:Uncharacterized protein n=1 Tax=Postia placenta MAD-698-R-SB12 TaxID=670580 RepID=A0A1X6MRX9_9APHY|nr:hypothetical protein POSPLADRAFT_1049115 [Postia placenta MAD-698-R-SB12]EED80018.1 predicted protein [Postia placenta Mad-698-R]OSX58962.1 hypothetical protein POSPLADRAFT_1049115 [Postia placenta MAD-698-R-SB12]